MKKNLIIISDEKGNWEMNELKHPLVREYPIGKTTVREIKWKKFHLVNPKKTHNPKCDGCPLKQKTQKYRGFTKHSK